MHIDRRTLLKALIAAPAMTALPALAREAAGTPRNAPVPAGAADATGSPTTTGNVSMAAPKPAAHGHKAGAALGTAAAFDPAGHLWTAQLDGGDGASGAMAAVNIVLRSSADQGRTWSAPIAVLRAPEPIEAAGESRPKLAFGPSGEIYVSYTRPLGKPYSGDIRFVRSVDGGRTFSEPVTVQRDRAVTTHRFDSLIVDPQGRVFVAWIDKRDADAARAAGRPYRGAAMYYAVSTDRGATFGPDVRAAEHTCECCRIALALDPQGRVGALWRHVYAPDVRDHAYTILPPAGLPAEPQRASFDEWHIEACPHHGPALAFAPDGVRHQVWFDAANDDGVLFYGATDAAGSALKPARIGGPQAEHGEVAVFGQQVALVWKEFDGSATTVRARLSRDGGRTWKESVAATTQGMSDHPHVVQRGAMVWLVWRTATEGVMVRALGGAA